MDIYAARNLVFSRLPAVQVPPESGTPQMGPVSTGLGEIFQFEVRGAGRSLMELRTILDWQIAPPAAPGAGHHRRQRQWRRVEDHEVQVAADALTGSACRGRGLRRL